MASVLSSHFSLLMANLLQITNGKLETIEKCYWSKGAKQVIFFVCKFTNYAIHLELVKKYAK